jgi:tetratricopeptide (TPR) repeat protein
MNQKTDLIALLKKGLECEKTGRDDAAAVLYAQVLQHDPRNPDALNLLGVLDLRHGRLASAHDRIAQAIRILPQTAFYHNNLGLVFRAMGDLGKAATAFEAARQWQPTLYDAHFNLGVVRERLGQTDEAIAAYEKALALNSNNAVLNNLGAAYLRRGELSKAIGYFEQVLKHQPDHADALYNLANAFLKSGDSEKAVVFLERRAGLPAPPPELPLQLGEVLQRVRRFDEAEIVYRKVLQTRLDPTACNNLAVILNRKFNYSEAETLSRQAIRLAPTYAEAHNNLGNILLATGRPTEADEAYSRAIDSKAGYAQARLNRGLARLLMGEFETGWDDFESRWQTSDFPTGKPKFAQPEWIGDDLRGRALLVYYEQGLGDTIQFSRYLPLLAARGGRVLFVFPRELRALFSGLAGVTLIDPDGPMPPFDVHAPLMSLPRLCATRLQNIPCEMSYLPRHPVSRFPLAPRTPDRMRVGVVWAGGARHPKDLLRSLTAQQLVPAFRAASCDFFSLQTPPRAAELKALPADVRVEDVGSGLRDFADTAAIMEQLDLVISADTSPLHLAGMLGRPTWGLLPFIPDWRWLLHREDSPWYPTMRLFRQTTLGDWTGVVDRVANALREEAERFRNPTNPIP